MDRSSTRVNVINPPADAGGTACSICANLEIQVVEEKQFETVRDAHQAFASSRSFRGRIWRYGPLIIWAALMFLGSSDLLAASHTSAFLIRPLHWLFPNASDETLAIIHFLIRKAAHFAEYAVLACLAARAFRFSARELLRAQWFWMSLALVVVYALIDEFHQSFVPSRTASIYDSIIDSIGGLFALTVLRWRVRKRHTE